MLQLKHRYTQAYTLLKQQVVLENKIYLTRKDTYLQLFTLLCNNCFSSFDLEKQLIDIQESINQLPYDNSVAIEYTLLYYLLVKNEVKITKITKEAIDTIQVNTLDTSRFPLNSKALIAYFLTFSGVSNQQIIDYINDIKNESISLIENGNVAAAIDGLFALDNIEERYLDLMIGYVKENFRNIGREKLAKFSLELIRWSSKESECILSLLENFIEQDCESWIIPEIQFALIESEKLVNSNLSKDIVNEILYTLKSSGEEWTKSIDEILEDGVIVDLKSYNRMPAFSPNEDVFSLLALTLGDRLSKYEINADEYDEYLRIMAIENIKNKATLSGGLVLSLLSLIIGVVSSINIILRWSDLKNISSLFSNLTTSPGKISEWLDFLKNPIVILLILFIWELRLILSFIKRRDLKIRYALFKVPIIGDLINKIIGE
ncbi:MAG: hypothetical protein Q8920_05615 [Bacillota bacterium]|nr:hypothetical protein [Bacillota bacterium]